MPMQRDPPAVVGDRRTAEGYEQADPEGNGDPFLPVE
jgi:hypothetical protein